MKNYFNSSLLLFALSGWLLFSCSQATDEPVKPDEKTETNQSMQRIIELANGEAERLFPAKSRAEKRVATAEGIKTIFNQESRGQSDTLIYVVNYEDEKGFAIISARDYSQPILAVVPEGTYDPEVGTDNPGFNLFMDAAIHYAKSDTTKKIEIIPTPGYPININGKYEKIVRKEVTHYGPATRITDYFKWGQDDIYGQFCPNYVCGCAPLAIASIVTWVRYHYGLDSRFYYTYPGADVPYEDIEWIEILRHHSSERYFSDGTHLEHICWAADKDAVHKSIGRICRQIGYAMNAQYSHKPLETSVRRGIAHRYLKEYIPEKVIRIGEFNGYGQMQLIDKGILYLEAALESDYTRGHAWVCDGYEYIKTEVKKYESDPPAAGTNIYNWKLVSTSYEEKMLSYMRWGWHGRFDGWYASTVLDPRNIGDKYIDVRYVAVCDN